MSISKGHKKNFEMLKQVFANGDAGLAECVLKATGEPVVVLVAFSKHKDESIEMTPFAMFFNESPYDMLLPPVNDVEAKEESSDE